MMGLFQRESMTSVVAGGRVEAKYVIPEALADAVESYIKPFTKTDPHAGGSVSYPVVSLYLDSPELKLYLDSDRGLKNRFKLRIRHYDDWEGGKIFFEIKRRLGDVIRKQRAGVPSEYLERFLKGNWNGLNEYGGWRDKERENLFDFRALQDTLAASPQIMVRYIRHAYVGDDDSGLRITLDRSLSCFPCNKIDDFLHPDVNRYYKAWDIPIVLEIKFNDSYPFWVEDLVRRFGLHRMAFAKYLVCVKELKKWGIPVGGWRGGL